MKAKMLYPGDVFYIKGEMKVYANVPERFIYDNKFLSKQTKEHDITIGEQLLAHLEGNTVKDLCKDLAERIDYHIGIKVKPDYFKSQMLNLIQNRQEGFFSDTFDTTVYVGEYVVEEAEMEGGGGGHNDTYPDGWKITARQLKDGKYNKRGRVISFYQSGCFSAMITPEFIQPHRRMAKRVKFETV